MKQVPYDSILGSYRFILLARLSTLADQYHNWVSVSTRTKGLVVCSCAHVTRSGWHVLESQQCACAYMSLIVGDTYQRLSTMLMRTCHSPWVARTGVLVMCLCAHVTHHGWPFLESKQCAHAHMSLTVGGMYWRLSSVPMCTCHSSWVACTGVLIVCLCAHVTCRWWQVLESQQCACGHMSLIVGHMYLSLSARRKAHHGRSMGFKSHKATTMDALVLIREM